MRAQKMAFHFRISFHYEELSFSFAVTVTNETGHKRTLKINFASAEHHLNSENEMERLEMRSIFRISTKRSISTGRKVKREKIRNLVKLPDDIYEASDVGMRRRNF
ncbi:hypothetical protein CEXT_14791 [Caerostris extrusa]|uniref:Uncharacterized protein n=1 Tax=Caerostris extrusa TaxID=172846 RepID=A0AAV4XMY9_CAEEX|nr:hypothetical protein CEXT_14791 [Caerostris extrusa]